MSASKRASSPPPGRGSGRRARAGLGEQRVVDVGDVAHARHRVAAVDQPALQDVVGEERRGVAEVGGVVRRDAARVHEHVTGLERHDGRRRRTGAIAVGAGRVVRRGIGGRAVTAVGLGVLDARELRRHPRLVAHVELQQHRGERLDGGGVGQLAGVERPAAGDLGDDLADLLRRRRGRRCRSGRRSRSARRGCRAPSPAGGGRRRRRGSRARRPARGRPPSRGAAPAAGTRGRPARARWPC